MNQREAPSESEMRLLTLASRINLIQCHRQSNSIAIYLVQSWNLSRRIFFYILDLFYSI